MWCVCIIVCSAHRRWRIGESMQNARVQFGVSHVDQLVLASAFRCVFVPYRGGHTLVGGCLSGTKQTKLPSIPSILSPAASLAANGLEMNAEGGCVFVPYTAIPCLTANSVCKGKGYKFKKLIRMTIFEILDSVMDSKTYIACGYVLCRTHGILGAHSRLCV